MTFPVTVTSEYTKKNLLEMQTVLHKRTARLCFILSLIGAALVVLGAFIASSFCIFCGVFWWLFFMISRNRPARKSAKKTVQSNEKNYGGTVKTTLKFYNTFFTAKNETTGAELRSKYDEVEKIIETENLLVIRLPDRVALMLDKRMAEKETLTELWKFLQTECFNAEIV